MRKIVVAGLFGVAALTAGAAANAADMLVKAPPPVASLYDWSGFYAGVNAGVAWDRGQFNGGDLALEPVLFTDVTGSFTGAPGTIVAIPGTFAVPVAYASQSNNAAFIGGGQFGYNRQAGRIVYGLEADVQGTNTSENYMAVFSQTFTGVTSNVTRSLTANVRLDRSWEASLRGRLGYAWDRLLVFGTAGVSFTSLQANTTLTAVTTLGPGLAPIDVANGTTANSGRQTLTGATFGAGFEYGLTKSVIVGAEYRYTHYGSRTFNLGIPPAAGPIAPTPPGPASISLDSQQVTARISYLFGH